MKYILSVAALVAGFLGFVTPASAATCPLSVGGAYKTSVSPVVYYITEACTKQLLNQDQYFSYFDSWNDTQLTTAAKLSAVKTDAAPATMGPHYFPRTGSLIKSPTDSSVYFVFWFTKSKIASEELFNAMGLDWSWVETLPQATFDKFYTSPDELTSTDQVFKQGLYLFRYTDSPHKIHLVLPDFKTNGVLRHHLKNETVVDYLGYRRDRIPMLSSLYTFQVGAPIDNISDFFTQYLTDAFSQMFSGFGDSFSNDFFNSLPSDDPLNFNSDPSTQDDYLTYPDQTFDNIDPFDFFSPIDENVTPPVDENQESVIQYLQVDPNFDHIRGNPKAKVTLIEYADFECPYCKQFHATMKQAMEKYGDQVRWVFRHYPLEVLHENAFAEALASECAAEQGKFWPFADLIFEKTNSNDGLDLSKLGEYAVQVGVDFPTFNSCYKHKKYAAKINEDIADAQTAGAFGTPFTLLLDSRGEVTPLSGAYLFPELEAEILRAL